MDRDYIVEITPEEANQIIEKFSRWIVERRMAAVAIITIESLKPLSFIGSQALHAAFPFAEIFINREDYMKFAVLLEDHKNLTRLVDRIDELDHEFYSQERKTARLIRKRRWQKIKQLLKINKRRN